jgi:hypothetical protein
MTHNYKEDRFIARNFPHYDISNFHRQMEEGLRRAPEERTKALKDFWSWFTRSA